MGVRKAHDRRRAFAQAPAISGEDPTRIRSRESEAGESREEIDNGDQEECEEWTDGSLQNPSQGFGSDEAVY
jgi:hypothetical protein